MVRQIGHMCTTMFVLFTTRYRRIYVTLADTVRTDGKIRRKHVASIGSIAIGADQATAMRDRVRLWRAVHKTLAALQLDHEAASRIMGAVHARALMPTPDQIGSVECWEAEQRLSRLEGSRHNTAAIPSNRAADRISTSSA